MTTDPWLDPTRPERRAAVRALLSGVELTAAEREVLAALDTADLAADRRAERELVDLGFPDVTRRPGAPVERLVAEQYVAGFDEPAKRAADRPEIGWWLGHAWLHRDDPDGPDALVERARARVREAGADASVREGLLTGIALLADLMTPDPWFDPLIGDHLGIPDPVDPAMVREFLATVRWAVAEDALVVTATGPHPALEVALDRVAARVGSVLGAVSRLAPELAGLPLRTQVRVTPSPGDDGRAAYLGAGARFRLAEDRIRELLMGEKLYGDRNLALREAYQNAVDACRHRVARLEYLTRTGTVPAGLPEPEVRFTQGVADGIEFVECVDTGVGMGLAEITQAFCQAGVRAADLPEHVAELREMALLDPPVELWTNSRFGIGALSYFMIASSLVVTTTRLHRDGTLGHTYRMHIASPDTYFRIEDLGPGRAPGTSIRLQLRSDAGVRALETLRDLVLVAPFPLTVIDQPTQGEQRWEPDRLYGQWAAEKGGIPCVRAEGLPLWWVDGQGALLSEGISANEAFPGAVIDLCGPDAPTLSVDRTSMLGHDAERVRELLDAGVPAVVAYLSTKQSDGVVQVGRFMRQIGSSDWLTSLASAAPIAADRIWRASAAAGPRIEVDGHGEEFDQSRTGVAEHYAQPGSLPTGLRDWTLSAKIAGGWGAGIGIDHDQWPPIEPVLPSDHALLFSYRGGQVRDLTPERLPLLAALAMVRGGRDAGEIVDRLVALGFEPPQGLRELTLGPDDRALFEHHEFLQLAGQATDQPALAVEVHQLAASLRRPEHEVAERLRAWGVPVVPLPEGPLRIGRAELIAISRDSDARGPWLRPEDPLPVAGIVLAATRTGITAAAVAESVRRLGYTVRMHDPAVLADLGPQDLLLLSRDLDSRSPFLGDEPVPDRHVRAAAERLGIDPDRVRDRLRGLGLRLGPVLAGSAEHPEVGLSRPTDRNSDLLPFDHPVAAMHVLMAAEDLGLEPEQVRADLAVLGYRVQPEFDGDVDAIDRLVVSKDLDGDFPIRNPAEPVVLSVLCEILGEARLPAEEVAARLTRMGYRVEVAPEVVALLDRFGLHVLSRDGDASAPWIDPTERVSAAMVALIAVRSRSTVTAVRERLTGLGVRSGDPATELPVVRPGRV